jgi:hypothetical protein
MARMSSPAVRLLDLLWDRYAAEVPSARTFVQLSGGSFRNDHLALRALARPGGGIALFERVFERLGWKRAGEYTFPDTHLAAIYMAHPEGLPRVFISELKQQELSARAQQLLSSLPEDPPPPESVEALAGWFCAPPPPEESALLELEKESQYGAWLLAFGRKVNHFTGSVDDVEVWQRRMREAGVPMKADIEGAAGSKLRQTATAAVVIDVDIMDNEAPATMPWTYAYFELAQRGDVVDAESGQTHRFEGFLGPQATQLFEMTRKA